MQRKRRGLLPGFTVRDENIGNGLDIAVKGFGNAEATYLMAKQMIEAGACCIQIENQVSDEKQCGHQDGNGVRSKHSALLNNHHQTP